MSAAAFAGAPRRRWREMRTMLTIFIVVAVLAVGGLAGAIVFSAPATPPKMESVSSAFADADFSGLPPQQHYTARDGTKLIYRAYPGDPKHIVIAIHGSSGAGDSMHFVASAIRARGPTVYALTMRGHEGTGRSGDVDYIGQLDDDVADFMSTLKPRKTGETRTLLGFSSGGGFALRVAGGRYGGLFDRLILVAPQLPYRAATVRPGAGGWISLAMPRIIALSLLNRAGITVFNGLPVLAFAVDRSRLAETHLTPVYTFRMVRNFGPSDDYRGDVQRAHGKVIVFDGGKDEIFRPDQFAPLLKPLRPDLSVIIVPGLSHMEMTTKPAALDAIASAAAN
jgi:non-heme chloroperoxidase